MRANLSLLALSLGHGKILTLHKWIISLLGSMLSNGFDVQPLRQTQNPVALSISP